METKYLQSLVFGCLVINLILPSIGKSQVQLGFKMGGNYASMNFEPPSHLDDVPALDGLRSRSSINTAITLSFPLNDNLAIQSELGFTGRGFRIVRDITEAGQTIRSVDFIIALNYIELGSVVLGQIGQKKTKFLVGAGPFVNYAVFGQSTIPGEFAGIDEDLILAIDLKRDINRWDLQLMAMIGISQRVGKITGTIDLRYQQGLFNIVDPDSIDLLLSPSRLSYHRSISWRLGIQFPIGKRS